MVNIETNKKNYIYQVETTVRDFDYISKIGDIVSKAKNVVFEVEISKYKVFEYKDYVLLILKLKDDTGYISSWLISNHDDNFKNILKMIDKKNARYYIKGDVSIIDIEDKDFIDEMNKIREKGIVIEEDFINSKALAIRAIECLK